MPSLRATALLLLCALLAACQSPPAPPPVAPAAPLATSAAPATSEAWVRTEIYCGLAPLDAEGLGLAAAEGVWRTFLDEEVTPRFPDGLTVLDAYGQWREEADTPLVRERSKVLILIYPDTPARRAGIEALCAAYKQRTGEKSVLVVTTPVSATLR